MEISEILTNVFGIKDQNTLMTLGKQSSKCFPFISVGRSLCHLSLSILPPLTGGRSPAISLLCGRGKEDLGDLGALVTVSIAAVKHCD